MRTNVNAMTRYSSMYHNKALISDAGNATSNFWDAVAKRRAETTTIIGKTTEVLKSSELNMEEYKKYIYDIIAQIPLNPSRALSNISITISDKGFESMKNNPEYEKWVLDSIKENFSAYNPWVSICGGGYETHFYGAAKESYHGESWYPGYNGETGNQRFIEKSEKSFWEKRAENQKIYIELAQKEQLKKQLLRMEEMQKIRSKPDDEKMEYLAGVPASVLLSML